LVNLDAFIARADFAITPDETVQFDSITTIGLRDLVPGSTFLPGLRKPDFQRETNHWSPEQVVSLLECFVNGDLIPSVILWRSPNYLFVIDGGHRLSVLRAWIEDDYGDGAISQLYFGLEISQEQRRVARRTRELVGERVGRYAHINARAQQADIPIEERRRSTAIGARALHIQWVTGNAEKAESSFFKINTEGTPLDDIEELLLRNRTKPIAIAARAVIRAGKGHKYWSAFDEEVRARIEAGAQALHLVLFEPELRRPVKTLDLPLGGAKGVRTALQVLIDFMVIANRGQTGTPASLEDYPPDEGGDLTVRILQRSQALAGRITGNTRGSLGLHPAVYFYGPSGVHSGPMFMGTVSVVGKALANNNRAFFVNFTRIRAELETVLIRYKDLIATILQKQSSRRRVSTYEKLLEGLINHIGKREVVTEEWLVDIAGLTGKVLTGSASSAGADFSDDVKSQAFITVALDGVPRCTICGGYLDAEKAMSYDHATAKHRGGGGALENLHLTHPYCNQGTKGGD